MSVCLYGNQGQHAALRLSVASHLKHNFHSIFTAAGLNISANDSGDACADALQIAGSWVGEDGLLATSDYLQREIQVFVSTVTESPLTYSPARLPSGAKPIMVAFLKPVHYCSVVPDETTDAAKSSLNC